jgi:mono/diheme cytochrome c family protein
MALLALVLFFVVLGLGVLFVAGSGGPGGARRRIQTQSRSGRAFAVGAFLVALLVLGVAIPAAVIATVKNRDSIPEAGVNHLTDLEKRGRELFGQRCANCHTLPAAGAYAKVGPNLAELRPPKALVLDAIHNGRANGNGQMAADLVEGEDAEAVAEFVAVVGGQDPNAR